MRLIRYIIRKVVDLWYGCFYIFSAFTLFLFFAIILVGIAGMLDIGGIKQDIILWGYVAVTVVYTVTKIILWVVKVYRKIEILWNKYFHKNHISNKPSAPNT